MKIELTFPTVTSIKEKRGIVNSVKGKLQARFKLSIAEIDFQDYYNAAMLGLTFVSNTRDHAVSRSQKIIAYCEEFFAHLLEDYDFIVEEY